MATWIKVIQSIISLIFILYYIQMKTIKLLFKHLQYELVEPSKV